MIKKITKVIFKDGRELEEGGGIPLSKGEKISFHSKDGVQEYVVTEKTVEFFDREEDPEVRITYFVE
ncbi:MAG: hypothetical protein V4674_03400 [Patescibacteria group bacterium]